MIIPNGVENGICELDRTFLLLGRVDGRYVADYVTVNAMLPGSPRTGLSSYDGAGTDGSWWMPLRREGLRPVERDRQGGPRRPERYASLTGGLMEYVDAQVLGSARDDLLPGGRRRDQAGPDRRAGKRRRR